MIKHEHPPTGTPEKKPAQSETGNKPNAIWTCPMHPQIERSEPGACPICGMALEPKTVVAGPEDETEPRDMTRRLRFLPWHGEMDAAGVPPPFTRVGIMRPVPSSPAEPLHDALQDDFDEHRAHGKSRSESMLPVPSNDLMERHQRRRLLQASLRMNLAREPTPHAII